MRCTRASLSIKSGQSFIQYTILIVIVSLAIIGMTAYLMRSLNARLKQEKNELYYYSKER
jgi:Flp pilus assembly pilin Flp